MQDFKYAAEYDAFKKGDRVIATRKDGKEVSGVIEAIWQGEPWPWPFSVRYESPIWPGEYTRDWFGPKDLRPEFPCPHCGKVCTFEELERTAGVCCAACEP